MGEDEEGGDVGEDEEGGEHEAWRASLGVSSAGTANARRCSTFRAREGVCFAIARLVSGERGEE